MDIHIVIIISFDGVVEPKCGDYYSLGDFKTAIESHQQALNIAKEIGNKDSEGSAYGNLGKAYQSLGDFKKAIEFHQQTLNIAKEIGNKDSEGSAYKPWKLL